MVHRAHVHLRLHAFHHLHLAGRTGHEAGAQRRQVELSKAAVVEFGDEHRWRAVQRASCTARSKAGTPVLQVVQRVVERHLLDHTELKSDEGHRGAVTLIQRFGSAANLNIHLHVLELD